MDLCGSVSHQSGSVLCSAAGGTIYFRVSTGAGLDLGLSWSGTSRRIGFALVGVKGVCVCSCLWPTALVQQFLVGLCSPRIGSTQLCKAGAHCLQLLVDLQTSRWQSEGFLVSQ